MHYLLPSNAMHFEQHNWNLCNHVGQQGKLSTLATTMGVRTTVTDTMSIQILLCYCQRPPLRQTTWKFSAIVPLNQKIIFLLSHCGLGGIRKNSETGTPWNFSAMWWNEMNELSLVNFLSVYQLYVIIL